MEDERWVFAQIKGDTVPLWMELPTDSRIDYTVNTFRRFLYAVGYTPANIAEMLGEEEAEFDDQDGA